MELGPFTRGSRPNAGPLLPTNAALLGNASRSLSARRISCERSQQNAGQPGCAEGRGVTAHRQWDTIGVLVTTPDVLYALHRTRVIVPIGVWGSIA
jgi:hypothetical protein